MGDPAGPRPLPAPQTERGIRQGPGPSRPHRLRGGSGRAPAPRTSSRPLRLTVPSSAILSAEGALGRVEDAWPFFHVSVPRDSSSPPSTCQDIEFSP